MGSCILGMPQLFGLTLPIVSLVPRPIKSDGAVNSLRNTKQGIFRKLSCWSMQLPKRVGSNGFTNFWCVFPKGVFASQAQPVLKPLQPLEALLSTSVSSLSNLSIYL